MRVLVTGGAGFIGSAIARRLLVSGHAVIVVDDLSTGFRHNVPSGALFLEADVSDPDWLAALPSDGIDAVCHLAAQSSGAISEEDPYHDFRVNATTTLLIARWCLAHEIKRFLYASSMAVYGDQLDGPVEEDTASNPKSHYGVSKLTSEHLLRLAARDGLNCTSFRMFSVYGPGQDLSNLKQGMVSIYLAYMLQGSPVFVIGSLDRVRDFVYIDDVVNAWERALVVPHTQSPVYNLGRGVPVTVRALLAALCHELALPDDYPIVEQPDSESDQYAVVADVRRAREELDWSPQIGLPEGLKMMVDWARATTVADK